MRAKYKCLAWQNNNASLNSLQLFERGTTCLTIALISVTLQLNEHEKKEESFLTLSFIFLFVKERSSVIRLCNDDEDEEKARICHFKSLIFSSSLLKKDYTHVKVTIADIKKNSLSLEMAFMFG